MHQQVRLHGHIDDTVEYFATAAARDVFHHRFYAADGDALRLFAPGCEIALDPQGVRHGGSGGTVCEYMFGVDQPLADLVKTDVRNRLVLFGAVAGGEGALSFTDRGEGEQPYRQIFFEGNAVSNTFFFVSGSSEGPPGRQQEELARRLGRILKRSGSVGAGDDAALAAELLEALGERSLLCLVRLVHKKHRAYYDLFRSLYFADKAIPEPDFQRLQRLAEEHGIDRYQQERMRIDVMYKHPANRRIVDEYRALLIDCGRRGRIGALENARLTRLKTLSVRNKIPAALFDTLDGMLKHENLVHLEEQDYLADARQMLEGLFLQERQIDAGLDADDMVRLLRAKRRASENRDHSFEQILLEAGKACDEKIRDGADLALLEGFSRILAYLDRFDAVADQASRLAFMANVRLSEEMLAGLLSHKRAFDQLAPGLFEELFFAGILANRYLGRYGRRKVLALREGLQAIAGGRMTLLGLLEELREIDREERLYALVLARVKERIRTFYGTQAEEESLRQEVTAALRLRGDFTGEIPPAIFRQVLFDVRKEAFYLHTLFPRILAEKDDALREDFLANSGLDRFAVEELEREYLEKRRIVPDPSCTPPQGEE